MTKLSCTVILITLLGITTKLYSQCDLGLSGLKLTVNQGMSGVIGEECVLSFDLSFSITSNPGNKYIYINLWESSAYGAGASEFYWKDKNAKMPTYAEIDGINGGNGPLAVIGIDTDIKTFLKAYSADPSNINIQNKKLITGETITSINLPSGRTFITVTGLKLTFPKNACASSLSLKGNIWSTQGNGGTPSIHCVDDQFDFTIGEIKVQAETTLDCKPPRKFSMFLEVSSFVPIPIQYKVYYDLDGNGELTSADNLLSDPVAYTSESNILVSNTNLNGFDYSALDVGFISIYDGTNESYKNNSYILVIEYINSLNTTTQLVKILTNNCQVLPVHFKSFNAYRNLQRKEQVLLKWETATEQNNRGFYVQRKVNGQWKNVAFAYSLADNGNSNTNLSYEYKEINSTKGISQYQIQQVDMDGKASYSEIKNVMGLDQMADVQIYPNPALNGKVNLLFSSYGESKDVIVADMNGRVVKQFRQVTNNNLTIEALQSGFYTIKIINHSTSATTVEKVIIKK